MPNRRRARQQEMELEELSSTIQEAADRISQTPAAAIMTDTISLADLTKALQGLQSQPQPNIKPLQYTGAGDLELFLAQFTDVAKVNKWSTEEHLLHLRLSLIDKATDCSRGSTVQEIQDMLRMRFGLNSRQARDKLRHLKRTTKQSVHELGMEAQRLTRLAYPDLRDQDIEEMALETFVQALDNKSVKRHLLASPATTVAEAVQKADEYLKIGENTTTSLAVVQGATETIPPHIQALSNTMKGLQTLLEGQTELLKKMTERKPLKCFECDGPHRRRFCPKLRNKNNSPGIQDSGNEQGPVTKQA